MDSIVDMVTTFSLRVNTRVAYASQLRLYHSYVSALSLSTDTPLTERQLCAVALLYVRTHKTTTLASFMSAIQSHYTDRGWGPLPKHAVYKKLIRGWNNMIGPVDAVTPKAAFSETQLRAFYDHLHSNHTFLNSRDWLMYLLSFYALLRVSEVHRLRWSDLAVSGRYVGVRVPYSKTSLTPVVIKLFIRSDWACPKRAFDRYFTAYLSTTTRMPNSNDALFVSNPKDATSAVTIEQSQRLLKTIITRTFEANSKGPPSDYAWHSFRRGGTTALINAGVPDSMVQSHGRWRSDCYLRYYDTVNVHTLLPTQMLHLHSPLAVAAMRAPVSPTPTGPTHGSTPSAPLSSWHSSLPTSK